MEDIALASRPVSFLEHRNLISQAEFHILAYMKVCLGTCVQIEIIPEAILKAEADVVESFLSSGSVRRLIKQFTFWSHRAVMSPVIVSINIPGWIIEIYAPVDNSCHDTELEFIVNSYT